MSAAIAFAPTVAASERVARSIARCAVRSLWDELALDPKPGLVSLRDAGAHDDMDASTFVRSLFALRRYFHAIAAAGHEGASFATLRRLGIDAEAAMLAATGGVNTHRGAIFALGLIAAAAGRAHACGRDVRDSALRRTLRDEWAAALDAHARAPADASHGAIATRRYGIDGARGEARRAFPSVFEIALPALRAARSLGATERHARLVALLALLASVDDTNVLHRGGAEGLAFVRRRAHALRRAPDIDAAARAFHAELVARRLSPGGCADLLAAALFVDALQSASG